MLLLHITSQQKAKEGFKDFETKNSSSLTKHLRRPLLLLLILFHQKPFLEKGIISIPKAITV